MKHYTPWIGDYRDPSCPYDDSFTQEDEEALWEKEVDRWIDERLESR